MKILTVAERAEKGQFEGFQHNSFTSCWDYAAGLNLKHIKEVKLIC